MDIPLAAVLRWTEGEQGWGQGQLGGCQSRLGKGRAGSGGGRETSRMLECLDAKDERDKEQRAEVCARGWGREELGSGCHPYLLRPAVLPLGSRMSQDPCQHITDENHPRTGCPPVRTQLASFQGCSVKC